MQDIESWLGQTLPPSYRTFLTSQIDDFPIEDFVLLYGQMSLVERNETYETKHYCPNHITIGDDSGGGQFLLSLKSEQVSLVDAGSMNPVDAKVLSEDFSEWRATGCPLPDSRD